MRVQGGFKLALWLALGTLVLAPEAAEAAITQPGAWSQEYANTAYPNGTVGTVAVPSGSSRLLLVAIGSRRTSAGAQTVGGVTYGGQALTLAQGDAGSNAQQHTYLYYLLETGIQAAGTTNLAVSLSGGTSGYTWVYAAVFAGVDQSAPFTSARGWTSLSTAGSAVGPFTPGLSLGAGDWPVEVIFLQRSATGTFARTIATWATGWGTTGGATVPVDVALNDGNWMPHL